MQVIDYTEPHMEDPRSQHRRKNCYWVLFLIARNISRESRLNIRGSADLYRGWGKEGEKREEGAGRAHSLLYWITHRYIRELVTWLCFDDILVPISNCALETTGRNREQPTPIGSRFHHEMQEPLQTELWIKICSLQVFSWTQQLLVWGQARRLRW